MSFSQEMKDFLSAYKTGSDINAQSIKNEGVLATTDATKKKTDRENDPDTLELQDQQARANLARTQDAMTTAAANRAHLAATTEYTRALAKRIAATGGDPQASGLYPPGAIGPQGPVPQGQGAVPLPAPTIDTEAYAGGGLVSDGPDSEPDDDPDDTPAPAAAPAVGAVPVNGPAPVPADMNTDISARARDAVKAGYGYGANAYGLTGTGALRTPAQEAKAKMFAQGHAALTDAEMEAAKKAVDPDGKLTDSQRNMAALGTVYQYWANKGEGDKAGKVAFQMLQHYRNATTRYAAIAAKAAEGGDMDLATKAAVKAYANVPDGNDIHIAPSPDNPGQLIYYYTDKDGNELAKGLATPQQLASSAMGLAQGGFDKALLSAAGQAEAQAKGGAGKPQTASDRTAEAKLPTGPVNAMKAAWQDKNPEAKPDDEMWTQTHDVAQHILQQNPKATANEAARAAHLLINPGTKDPEKPDFKIIPGNEGEPHTVQFNNGAKLKLDDDQLNAVMNSRAARIKQQTDKINADMEAQDGPDRGAQALEGVKQVAGAIPGVAQAAINPVGAAGQALASKALDGLRAIYGDHIPQQVLDAVEATKGAIGGAASRVAGAVGNATSNSGAVPADGEDRPI